MNPHNTYWFHFEKVYNSDILQKQQQQQQQQTSKYRKARMFNFDCIVKSVMTERTSTENTDNDDDDGRFLADEDFG